MVGFKKVEKYDSPTNETPKYKRKNLFSRLGHRISRAFHRTHHDNSSKRINKHQHSHSTGDLISDIQSPPRTATTTRERLHDHSDARNSSISADDRANSIGHLEGACASGGRFSGSGRSNQSFLPSGFRDELNSKLRLRPGYDNSEIRSGGGTKSADSCTSLASNDSFICTTNTTSPMLSGDSAATSMTPSTHESHAVAGASPSSSTSPIMAGMQHKLAVSRQRKRRPPTRSEPVGDLQNAQNDSSGISPLGMGCSHFFATSSNNIPLPFSHSPMDLISEEVSEGDSKSPHTPKDRVYTENLSLAPLEVECSNTSPMAPPRPSLKPAMRPNRNTSVSGSSDPPAPIHRPVSMHVSPTLSDSQKSEPQSQQFSPTPLCDRENIHMAKGPVKPPRVKSRSTSEQSGPQFSPESISRTKLSVTMNFEQNSPSGIKHGMGQHSPLGASPCERQNCNSHMTNESANSNSQEMLLTKTIPIARPRTRLSAFSKTQPVNGAEVDSTPKNNVSETSSALRPVSMFVPTAPDTVRSPHSPNSGSSTPDSRNPHKIFRSASRSNSHDDAQLEEEVEPERTSVADRAALFGAKLHSKRTSESSSAVPVTVARPNEINDRTPTSNARPVSVFDLVRNFEQTH